MEDPIDESEALTRYLREDQVKKGDIIAPSALRPSLKEPGLSTFRIDNLSELNIWQLGDEQVAKKQPKNYPEQICKFRADMKASRVRECRNVNLQSSPDTHERHADIWFPVLPSDKNSDQFKEIRADWNEIANHLALISDVVKRICN